MLLVGVWWRDNKNKLVEWKALVDTVEFFSMWEFFRCPSVSPQYAIETEPKWIFIFRDVVFHGDVRNVLSLFRVEIRDVNEHFEYSN